MVFVKLTPIIIALTLSEEAISFSNICSLDNVVLGIKLSLILSIFIVFFSSSFIFDSNSFNFYMIDIESILSCFASIYIILFYLKNKKKKKK